MPSTLRSAWRAPGFSRLYSASTLARLANEMAIVGLALFVLARTGEPTLAGATVAAFTLPSVASGPVLGAWMDRVSRPLRLVSLDQAVGAIAAAGLVLAAGRLPDFALPMLGFAAGVTAPLSYGGVTSLLPQIVPERSLSAANALEATSFNVAAIAGPALAGTLTVALGPTAPMIAQAAMKIAALLLFLAAPALRIKHRAHSQPITAAVMSGLRHVLRTRVLLAVTLTGGLALAGRGLLTLAFPLFAVHDLGADTGLAGFMWAAFAAGSALGALALVRARRPWPSHYLTITGTAAAGAVTLLWPLADEEFVMLVLIGLAGIAYGPGLAATFSVRQEWTPESLRGGVFTTAASLKPALFALGAVAAGPAVGAFGAGGTLLLAGATQILAAAVGVTVLRVWVSSVRAFSSDAEVEP